MVDAFLVRMTLIPALTTVMGRHAWWLPKWLDRILPNVDLEGAGLDRAPDNAPPDRSQPPASAAKAPIHIA